VSDVDVGLQPLAQAVLEYVQRVRRTDGHWLLLDHVARVDLPLWFDQVQDGRIAMGLRQAGPIQDRASQLDAWPTSRRERWDALHAKASAGDLGLPTAAEQVIDYRLEMRRARVPLWRREHLLTGLREVEARDPSGPAAQLDLAGQMMDVDTIGFPLLLRLTKAAAIEVARASCQVASWDPEDPRPPRSSHLLWKLALPGATASASATLAPLVQHAQLLELRLLRSL
jgi:hypothetical protein